MPLTKKSWNVYPQRKISKLPSATRDSRKDIRNVAALSQATVAKLESRLRGIRRYARNASATKNFIAVSQPPKTRQIGGGSSTRHQHTTRAHDRKSATQIQGS